MNLENTERKPLSKMANPIDEHYYGSNEKGDHLTRRL
jgi:hypothetical protein